LRVWLIDDDPDPHIDRELAIGHLDPIGLVSGVQARLQNLGYPCAVTGESDETTLAALRIFRARNGLSGDEASDPDSENAGSDTTKTEDAADSEGSSDAAEGGQTDAPSPARQVEKGIDDPLRTKLHGLYEGR
jgi:hypothetical protein